jgi:NitT/TauT family transport system substrate-binding protein
MKKVVTIALVGFLLLITMITTYADQKPVFRIAWSHYTGWEPWEYARQSGLLKKWGDKYGIDIQLDLINDYAESINLYTGGKYDGCAMTNMDALINPAAGGKDSTALIMGDFSNGNDGIVLVKGDSVKALKDKKVYLVMNTVSHYLLSQALAKNNLKERELKLVNVSDADIAAKYMSDNDPNCAVVTWNPMLMQVRNKKGAKMVFSSAQIPGEIMDLMVVRTDAPESLKKALVGAWFATMQIMSGGSKESNDAIKYMAQFAGGTEAEFRAQLKTTAMFYTPAAAVDFTQSPKLKETMEYVRTFSFEKGLFGEGAKNKDFVGIQFSDGSIIGNPKNVKFRFDANYMQMAAAGKL